MYGTLLRNICMEFPEIIFFYYSSNKGLRQLLHIFQQTKLYINMNLERSMLSHND